MPCRRFDRIISPVLWSATVLIGLAFVAIMPPFEGTDEMAHYSRIVSTAYPAQLPHDRIAAEVDDYQSIAPMPDYWLVMPAPLSELKSHTTPEYDLYVRDSDDPSAKIVTSDGRFAFFSDPQRTATRIAQANYLNFFHDRDRVRSYVRRFRQTPAPNTYAPGREPNWEYQHPPLFYLALALPARLLAGQPLVDKVLVLRGLCFALVAVALAIIYSRLPMYFPGAGANTNFEIAAYGMLFPFLFPTFWGQFARISNDSLCVLLCAAAWTLLINQRRNRRSLLASVFIGVVLGLGCLTKLTMLFVAAGLIAFLAYRKFRSGEYADESFTRKIAPVLCIAGTCGLIGGSWYVYSSLSGRPAGSLEIAWVMHDRDFLVNLHRHVTLGSSAKAIYSFLVSAVYLFHSNSKAHADNLSGGLFVLDAAIVAAYFVALRREKFYSLAWLPVWIITPVAFMLLVHLFCLVIEFKDVYPEGRYLFVALPLLMMIVGIGIREIARRNDDLRLVARAALLAAPFATLCLFLYHAAIFGGCARETHLGSGEFVLNRDFCLADTPAILSNLSVVAWPATGFVSFTVGWLLLVYGSWLLWKFMDSRHQAISPPIGLISKNT